MPGDSARSKAYCSESLDYSDFRAILVRNALCSSADETHDAMMNIYTNRFGQQVECVSTDTLLETWRVT
jgi:hypothetical protein